MQSTLILARIPILVTWLHKQEKGEKLDAITHPSRDAKDDLSMQKMTWDAEGISVSIVQNLELDLGKKAFKGFGQLK